MPYGSYWHSCDVLPEGRRPRGHSHNCANNSHMVTREAQATTNLLPVPGKVRLSKLPKPKPARCTLFPWIQLSVPHGIYWHTSYGVLRVCYFTLRATNESCALCQCACAEIGHAPYCSCKRVVHSVLAPTRASSISRHRFGQG